jgi:hypothetical protein
LNAAVAGSLLLYEASRQRGGGSGQDKKQKRNTGIPRSAQDDDLKLGDGIKEGARMGATLNQVSE